MTSGMTTIGGVESNKWSVPFRMDTDGPASSAGELRGSRCLPRSVFLVLMLEEYNRQRLHRWQRAWTFWQVRDQWGWRNSVLISQLSHSPVSPC